MVATIVRFTGDNEKILEALKRSAQNNHRSLNGEMMRAFEFFLKEAPEAHYEVKPAGKEATKKKTKSP